MDGCTVADVINYDSSEIRPVIVNFQNGKLNNTDVNHEVYEKEGKRFVKVETRMVYEGEVIRNQLCNTCLLIVDKATGKGTLVPVDFALLAPEIRTEEDEKQNQNDYSSAVSKLKKEFGSKRTKRLAQQEERLKMNTSNTTEYLQKAVEEMHVDENELETTVDNAESGYKPPINRNAEQVSEIYILEELVPQEVLESLEEFIDDPEITTNLITNYFQKKADSDSASAREKCKVLLVIDCILKFLSVPAKTIFNKSYTPCDYSQEVAKYILDNFTVVGRNGRNRSNFMKDKAICYCIVLMALANDYIVNLDDLCKELKGQLKKLQNISRTLAFVPLNQKEKNIVTLKLPLPAPVLSFGRGTKRKR